MYVLLYINRVLSPSMQSHKNYQNMTEIEAKVAYVKLARSLKTYGVSFFLVKVNPWVILSMVLDHKIADLVLVSVLVLYFILSFTWQGILCFTHFCIG